jgi:hypothetical protein
LLALPAPAHAQSTHELNIVPIAGGDSDIGIGGGAVGDFAVLGPGAGPASTRWRLDASAFISFKLQEGKIVVPFNDLWVDLLVPHWRWDGRLHLDARLSFTQEGTLKYTGIGNASPPIPTNLPIEVSEYERLHPTASVEVRTRVTDIFYVLGGASYTYNRLSVADDTILAVQHATGPPLVRQLLGNFDPHGVGLLTAEAQIDTRDDEFVTTRGQFHTLRFRVSPRLGDALPYSYERVTGTARFYALPITGWLGLSFRVVGDVLLGTPPFYELARFDETAAIGGGKAVRGVPAQRYYGKVKVFGNLELTSPLKSFSLRHKPFMLSITEFFDTGRTWTELFHSNPSLDGTGIGLKYGVGGGLRLQEGRTFVLRLEVAWSPDATPIGAYFAAGQLF